MFWQANAGFAWAGFLTEIILLGGLLAVWELLQPKTRLRQISRLAGFSILFSLITMLIVAITRTVL
jgi:hypothetical protein